MELLPLLSHEPAVAKNSNYTVVLAGIQLVVLELQCIG